MRYSDIVSLHILMPTALLVLLLLGVAFIHYASPNGPLVTAIYDAHTDAFATAMPYATAIISDNAALHSVTVYAPTPTQRALLRKSGAMLIDPTGVPLCSSRTIR